MMQKPALPRMVVFGAGKIGRSFIGPLFSQGGFEVVFIDINRAVIDELNLRHQYNLVIKSETESVIHVQNVRGVWAGDSGKVLQELLETNLVTLSVGLNALKQVVPLLASGIRRRFENPHALPLDVILAENLRNAAGFVFQELASQFPVGYPLKKRVGLIETSIGKMVPMMLREETEKDLLQIFAEPYNTLIVDKLAFRNPIPAIEGLAPKENMKAWVDRKLFIHNLGHAAAAYHGYFKYPESRFMYEVLADDHLKGVVRNTMLQAANILLKIYPDEFTIQSLTEHIDDLLYRFQNRALGDTVFRVGCDLNRKLGKEDRIAGAIHLAIQSHLPYDLLLKALVVGCHFRAKDPDGRMFPSDLEFVELYQTGIRNVLQTICGFHEPHHQNLLNEAEELNTLYQQIRATIQKSGIYPSWI